MGVPGQDARLQEPSVSVVGVIAMGRPSWSLGDDEIHLWTVSLTRSAAELARLRELLTNAEYVRACTYRPQAVRDDSSRRARFLRLILSEYLSLDPMRVVFHTSNTGKPVLAGGGLHFNVSHSGEIGLIAVTLG